MGGGAAGGGGTAPSGEPWRADRLRSQKCHRGSALSLSSADRPAILKTHPGWIFSPATREHRGIVGNVFCSTPTKCLGQTTRWMLTTSGNVQSVKISRAFAAKYLAFHGLIFFFDALRIKIRRECKTTRPPNALYVFETFVSLRPQS